MRLTFERGRERYPVQRAAVVAAVVLAVLGAVAAALPSVNEGPVLCPFRAVTGLPCPTCGLLRAAHLIMRGQPARAFSVNPLDTVLLLAAAPAFAGLWLAHRRTGLRVKLKASSRERALLWAVLFVTVAANWAYVLAAHLREGP